MTLIEAVACVLLADLLTGVFHWWEDTYGRVTWPGLGPWLIAPNVAHHADGGRSLEARFADRSGHAVAAAALVQIPIAWAGVWTWHVAAVLLLAAVGNEVHAWAHGIRRPWGVVLLQDMGVLQTPAHHARHHRPPFDRHFCTLTNLVNPVLERVRFWRRLEAVVALFGINPARGSADRGGL